MFQPYALFEITHHITSFEKVESLKFDNRSQIKNCKKIYDTLFSKMSF